MIGLDDLRHCNSYKQPMSQIIDVEGYSVQIYRAKSYQKQSIKQPHLTVAFAILPISMRWFYEARGGRR